MTTESEFTDKIKYLLMEGGISSYRLPIILRRIREKYNVESLADLTLEQHNKVLSQLGRFVEKKKGKRNLFG